MELIYAALLLHSAGKPVEEGALKKVVDAAGGKSDEASVKALVANLKDINIDEAIKQVPAFAAAPAAAGSEAKAEDKSEEQKHQDDEKKAEEAASGLSSLFG